MCAYNEKLKCEFYLFNNYAHITKPDLECSQKPYTKTQSNNNQEKNLTLC